MAVTFINHDDATYVFLLLSYPSDFIVIMLISKELDAILKGFNLLGFGRLSVLELHESFLGQPAFPLELSSKIAKLIEGKGLAEIQSILVLLTFHILRDELRGDYIFHHFLCVPVVRIDFIYLGQVEQPKDLGERLVCLILVSSVV